MIKKKLLVVVLIAFLLSGMLSPALIPLIMAASLEYAASIKTKTTFQGPYPGTYSGAGTETNNNIYGFHVLFKQCWSSKSYGPGSTFAIYSGSSIAFSKDGKTAYIAAVDGVHVVDVQSGKEVAKVTIPGVSFCTNSPQFRYISRLSPRQLAPGPNGSMVAAPHFSNPYIITPDGKKIEIPVYGETTAKSLYSYQITNDGNYYAWGNSKGVATFTVNNDYSSQVLWKKDLSSEGGVRQVSVYGSTVAAVTDNKNLYILNKNDGNTVKVINNVLAVTPAKHSHYAAIKVNNTMSGLVLVHDDGTVVPIANVTGLVKAMNSGVTKGYSAVFMVTDSALYVYILNYTALEVVKSAFKEVIANDVSVSESSDVIYFATVGKQTLVGRVNGTDIYFDGVKNNDQPSLNGAVKGDPQINPLNNTFTNITMPTLPPGSMLLGEVYEAGACAQISLFIPAPAVAGPHMEARGQFIQDINLATGNTTRIYLASGGSPSIMPLNIKITTKKVIIARAASDLIDPNTVPQPEYHDMIVSGAFGWQVARSSSFWNTKLDNGKLIATYNYSATFFKQNLATGAFPAPSAAIWYYDVIPTQVGQYDGLDVQAQVTSTQAMVNVPGFVTGEASIIYKIEGAVYFLVPLAISMTWAAEGGEAGATPIEQLASHIKEEVGRKRLLAKLSQDTEKINQINKLMEMEGKTNQFAIQKLWLDAELNSGIISEQEYNAAMQEILNAVKKEGISLNMLGAAIQKAISYLEQGMTWEGVVSIMTGMAWAGSKQMNIFYIRALEAGISPSDVDQILQRAIKDATNANLQSALNTVPTEMVYLSFITGLSNSLDTLNELAQAGSLYANISGSKVYLRSDDIAVFTKAIIESVQKYANVSAIMYSSVTGQRVYPQAGINTLRDLYYWAKQAVLSAGGSEEDAKRVASLLMTFTINTALYDGYQALTVHLQKRGYSNADIIALQLTRWVIDASNYAGSIYVYRDKINSAFPPPPELIAQYFEYYTKQNYGSSTQSIKADTIRELANIIRNSKLVVLHDREEFKKYITMGGLTGSQIVWNIQNVMVKTSGLVNPFTIAGERFGTYAFISATLLGIAKLAPSLLGKTTLGLTVSALAEFGVLAVGAYFGTNVLISSLMTPDLDKMGATTLRGLVFDVSKSNKRIGVFAIEPPPSAVISNYPQQITHRDWFKTQLSNAAREFGYDEIIVVYSNPENIDAKSILMNTVGSDAMIKRIGVIVIPYIWMQPDVIAGEDKKATMNGYVQISYLKVIGTISKYEERVTNAGLTPDQWKQIKISVYGSGSAHLGDYVPLYATDKIDNSTYQSAVFTPGGCYRNVYYVEISIPQSLSQISASLSVIIDGIIIASLEGSGQLFSATVEYSGSAEFRPVALGIFNLNELTGYPLGAKPQIIEVMVNQPYSVTKQIEGQDIWRAAVNGSAYNYLFTESGALTRLMPYGGKYFVAQYWIYLNASRPENPPTPPTPTPTPNPHPYKPDNNTYVTPPTNQTVMPPWMNVSKGYVGLAMYLNGTNSYALLPRLLTAYVYTQEPNVTVRLTVWWSIEFENHTAGVWQTYRYGTLYNVTVTTPGGKYWRAVNVYIANYSEFAAALAKQLNTLVVLRFWGIAVRLDNGRNMSAVSPPVMVYPDLQGKMTTATPSVTVYVYNAWNLTPISGASVSFVGPSMISGSTNSSGYFATLVNNGSYILTVSRAGYKNLTQYLYIARDMVLNVPLVPNSADNKSLSWLTILVRTLDGMPLQGASIYINGTYVGNTDADGMWYGLFKWGNTQTVKVNYTTWSETRKVPILGPRVLTTFTANVNSQIFTPMVWAYMVYAVPVAYSNHTIMIEGGVVTNSNNTYRVEVGIKDMNGTVITKKIYNATVDKPGTHVFGVDLQAPPIRGRYKPYLNITWAKADNDYRDNYIEGVPFKVVDYMNLVIHVIVSVDKWGKNAPGLIYPGDTVYNVTIRAWFVDSSVNDMKYSDWLAKRGGQKLNLHRPLNITVRKLVGTLDLVETGSKRLNITSLTFGDSIIYSEKITAPFARYLVITISVPGLGNNSVIEEDEGDITITWNGYKIQLPPHLIVKGVDLNSIPVVRPGDNVSVTLRVWTNYLPGEGTHGMIMLGFDMAGNGTLRGFTVAPAPELTNGEQKVSGTLILPKNHNYNFSWWQPSKTYDAIFTVTGTPDVWSGDNYVKTKITILNTDSFVTWLLIGMGVVIVLIIILAFINAIKRRDLSRLAMSEWLERVQEKTIPSRSVHRRRESNPFNLEWFEKINKDEEK